MRKTRPSSHVQSLPFAAPTADVRLYVRIRGRPPPDEKSPVRQHRASCEIFRTTPACQWMCKICTGSIDLSTDGTFAISPASWETPVGRFSDHRRITSAWAQGVTASTAKEDPSARFRVPGASPGTGPDRLAPNLDRLGPWQYQRHADALSAARQGPMTISSDSHPHALPFAAPAVKDMLRVRCRGRPPPATDSLLDHRRVATPMATRLSPRNEKDPARQRQVLREKLNRGCTGLKKFVTADSTGFADGSVSPFLRTSDWAVSCRASGGAS